LIRRHATPAARRNHAIRETRTVISVGLFSIGLDTYWGQFAGLHDRLMGYHATIRDALQSRHGCTVVDAGMVDTPDKGRAAGRLLGESGVDVIFLFISTYALSSTVLPVVQRAKVPVIVLNVQPVAQLDYEAFNALGDRGLMTGIWLEHCQACSAPEIASVFERAGVHFHLVSGWLQDEETWREIGDWVAAAKVAAGMRDNRVGVLGHYYCGMLDVYADMAQQSAAFGNHFEIVEMCEVKALRDALSDTEVQAKIGEFHRKFEVSPECDAAELERAARTSVALDKLVEAHRLGSMAYYYEGHAGNDYENIVTSVIAGNTLLTGRNVPVAGECEVKNAQAMKIMDLFGVGGSFSELYLADFKDDVVYLGHDGPAHFGISEGRVGLVPLPVYHGKPGKGLSIQMTVRHGPVTLLSVIQRRDGTLKLLVAEAESVPGPILQIGNTNSRYRFPIGAKGFLNAWSGAGPAHHCAIGVGHIADRIGKLGQILGLDTIRIC
jgi:L-arabinose isomerase